MFLDLTRELRQSRMCAGLRFYSGIVAFFIIKILHQGRKVAEFVYRNAFQPLR